MEIEIQKMEEIKKAFADILLNTAKEGAARILESEHKSRRFQKELANCKEESLCTIVRMKNIMDSKLAEAEVKSQSLQKKLEEVEAQLSEAEQIIVDIRYELSEVHGELAKHKKEQSLNVHHLKRDLSSFGYEAHDSDQMKIDHCSQDMKNDVSDDHMKNDCSHNADLSSITMGRNLPELCRNSCTQRIHAFESATLDEDAKTLPSHLVECVDLISEPEPDSPMQADNKLCKSPVAKVNRRRKRKILFGKAKKTSPKKPQAAKIIPRGYLKQNVKYRDTLATSYRSPPCNLDENDQPLLSRCKRGFNSVNANAESDEEKTLEMTENGKVSEANTADSNQGDDDLNIKYTFHRKRKNAPPMSNPEETTSVGNCGKKQTSASEPLKSLIDEPRDSRRLAQGARQLISMSGKKWS